MKTNLDISIQTDEQAVNFLTELHDNNESYHPEDNAHDIIWDENRPTKTECDQLNNLMNQIYENTDVDPCEILLDLACEEGRYFDTRE